MSSLEAKRLYYDTNTGLMPIIQALIAPPVSEEDAETERRAKREKRERKVEKKEGLDLHPYYKKRGKSHNHDYCDACLEGGNLLCCDTCEASFHLECNDPPLHVDEIPLDMWQCRRCTKLHKESPSKKGSPGKNSKRRKSNNSNTSATSTNNYKKLKTGHGHDSEEEGFARPPSKDNHYMNHSERVANDSGDSDISSVSTTRRRGRPRKYPLTTPATAKPNTKGNLSDSDNESVQENRSKRFMKRRKKEPPKNNTTSPGDKSKNPADGDQSTSSDEGPLHTGDRDRLNVSGSSTNNNFGGKNRSLANAVVSSREAPPPRMSSVYRGDSSHIGYLKYSSSDDEDSHSEKSLYFRDMVLQGSKPPTEEYLDENTGEIMTRSLCENEYLNKLLSKKNTTSEIDDIERINELLLKTKNMAMDPNIIKKIIGCSIPEQSDESEENGNAYDSDEDERTSDEDVTMGEKPYHPRVSSNHQKTPLVNSTISTPAVSTSINTLPGQSKDISNIAGQSKDISNTTGQSKVILIDSSRTTDSSTSVNSNNLIKSVAIEHSTTTALSNVDVSKSSDCSQSSNDSNSIPTTTLVPDQSISQSVIGQSKPIDDLSIPTNENSKDISEEKSNEVERDEEMEVDEEEKSDEELCSLLKFSSLWKEKFERLEEAQGSEEEEEDDSGRESDSCDESEEDREEVKSLVPLKPMDVQSEGAVLTLSSCDDSDQAKEKDKLNAEETSKTQELRRNQEISKTKPLSVNEEFNKSHGSNKTQPTEKRAILSQVKEEIVERTLDDIQIDWSDKSNQLEVKNAMQILLSAVAHSNPEQFSLGKYEDKSYDKYVWPGTDKIPDNVKISSKRVRSLMNLIEVDSEGLVPHPVKICHSCGRACSRRTPLLGCDYCPLYYHLDCLNPPLASAPTLTWMCPAHPTTLLDEMVGREGGVVERSEVWDAWSTRPVSEEQITREFLTKVRSKRERPRMKRNRIPAKIPGFVSHHYRCPPELAPSLQEAIHLEAVREKEREKRETVGSSKQEKEQFLRSLISLETQLLRLSYENKSSSSTSGPVDTKLKSSSESEQPTKLKVENEKLEGTPSDKSAAMNQSENTMKPTEKSSGEIFDTARIRVEVNGDLVSTVEMDTQEVLGSMLSGQDSADKLDSYFRFGEDFIAPPPPSSAHHETVSNLNNFKLDDINPNNFKVEDLFITTTLPLTGSDDSLILDKSGDACIEEDKSIEEEIVSLDEAVMKEDSDEMETKEGDVEKRIEVEEKIKEEKEEDVKEVKMEGEKEKPEINVKRSLFVQLNELLRNSKLPADDKTGAIIDLSDVQQLNPDLVQVLALERLSQLTVTDTPSLLPQPHLTHPYAPFVPRRNAPPSRLHAQLCPLSRKLSPVPMTSNWMTIGLGPNSTVDLSSFGFCSRVSAQHAVIFYEMASNTYELINHSEFGSRVDSILYSLDTSLAGTTSSYRHAPSLSSAHTARLKFRAAVSERIKQDPFEWDVRGQRMRIREGMERRRKRRRRRVEEEDSGEERMPLHYGETIYKCPCLPDEKQEGDEDQATSSSRKASSQAGGGKQSSAWESTCLVRHGSLLQFGCFKFVFSITDHTRPLPPPYDTLNQSASNAPVIHRRASQPIDPNAELSNTGTGETVAAAGESNTLQASESANQTSLPQDTLDQINDSSTGDSSTGDSSQHKLPPCRNKAASSKQGKGFKPTRRKSTGIPKNKRRSGSSANAKDSTGSSTDTCSESEEYEAEKD